MIALILKGKQRKTKITKYGKCINTFPNQINQSCHFYFSFTYGITFYDFEMKFIDIISVILMYLTGCQVFLLFEKKIYKFIIVG